MRKENERDLGLLVRVHELYRSGLAEHAQAKAWLVRQGVTNASLVERFELGYASGTLKSVLPRSGGALRALRDLGLLSGRGAGREHLVGCVVIPLRDTTGRLVELVGYPISGGPPLRAGLAGAVFNWSAMRAHADVKLFFDPLDTLRKIARGDEAVISLFGDEWTLISEGTFRELAPHRVLTHRKSIAQRLGALGVGQNNAPSRDTPVENGFAASFGRRRYIVQAVSQDNPRHLRALLRAVGSTPGRFHLDAFDLYSSRDRAAFVREAALLFDEEPQLVEADLGRILGLAEEHL